MNRDARYQRCWVTISVLALIGQLLLPIAHAQSMVRDGGDPLLYAFCGRISPALVAKLRQSQPQELPAQARSERSKSDKISCPLCVAVHGALLGSAVHRRALSMASAVSPSTRQGNTATALVCLVFLPQLRGPPVHA